jgi:hypothetical protein
MVPAASLPCMSLLIALPIRTVNTGDRMETCLQFGRLLSWSLSKMYLTGSLGTSSRGGVMHRHSLPRHLQGEVLQPKERTRTA